MSCVLKLSKNMPEFPDGVALLSKVYSNILTVRLTGQFLQDVGGGGTIGIQLPSIEAMVPQTPPVMVSFFAFSMYVF